MICAGTFYMATENQKKELQEQIKNDYDEKLKKIIEDELEAQEIEAQD